MNTGYQELFWYQGLYQSETQDMLQPQTSNWEL